jgi:hypothetical protein
MGFQTTASSTYSTAMGNYTTASETYSTAMGNYTTASSIGSTAMGNGTIASGNYSTAMGATTTASGILSTALGFRTIASDYNSLVVGQNNLLGSTVTNNATDFNTANTAFVIGNGTSGDNRSDALTVLFDGTTNVAGSVTATEFIGDGSQLTNLPSSSPFEYIDGSISAMGASASGGSFAVGDAAYSSGYNSRALGVDTKASADGSTAMGGGTTASGHYSTAMGITTTASGVYSTAMGVRTAASDYNSLVVGRYNLLGSTVTNSAEVFSLENTAFVIGNGTFDYSTQQTNRSDALTVLFDGTTNVAGSVTATSFIGDGSQLTNLSVSSPFSLNDSSGNGIQSQSSTASGSSSRALGTQTTASGDNSTAMGYETTASGLGSTAMGRRTIASGVYSTAIGSGTEASNYDSTAMGFYTTASGLGSTAMGSYTTASDYGSTVIGQYNSSGSSATSADSFSASAPAFVIGNGTASDATSDAFKVMFNGDTTVSNDLTVNGDVVVSSASAISLRTNYGTNETITVTNSQGASSNAIVLNAIAGGVNIDAYDNIKLQSFAGKVEIGNDLEVSGDLSIKSDARLKANIISLGSTLAKLLQIDGKTYTMKKDENKKQKIGVLAQDVEKVFPELVSESNGVKSVNYQGLVPVLINALKEQDSKMNEQDSKMNEQEARIERLEKLLLDS